MGEVIPNTKIRFEAINILSKKYNIKLLCRMAGVSLSGYYRRKELHSLGRTKEQKEQKDVELIRELSSRAKQKYGYRSITMLLQVEGHTMNHKKVLRLMSKYYLLAKIRRKNPYKQMMKKTQEHSTAPNILNRTFRGILPLKKLGTDITYLRFKGRWIYLSIVKDMVTGEVLSFALSESLGMEIIQATFLRLEIYCTDNSIEWALLHSDQGFHYTHPSFRKWLKKLGCIQSMSRKGNCIDNAPTESFFGHLKDEIDISPHETLKEVEKYLESYIFYYNNERPQWTRKKMTPVQYKNHLMLLTH